MLTPAIKASSTSEPRVIRENAFSTQVTSPPFLKTLPLAEEMTTGRMPRGAITVGAWPDWPKRPRGTAAARPAVAPAMMKSRRFKLSVMAPPPGFPSLDSHRWIPIAGFPSLAFPALAAGARDAGRAFLTAAKRGLYTGTGSFPCHQWSANDPTERAAGGEADGTGGSGGRRQPGQRGGFPGARPAAAAGGGLQLHRGRRRRRDLAAPQPLLVRQPAAQAARAARREPPRHLHRGVRPEIELSHPPRSRRVSPDGASGR